MKTLIPLKKVTISLCCFILSTQLFSQSNSIKRFYEIWDNHPAKNRGHDYSIIKAGGYPYDADWENESYPIGNGYMGANIFGRTDIERIQITEKTLANEGFYGLGGLTNFAEIYLDFDHNNTKNYKRSLNLNEGILSVDYENDGVYYKREYLANYPENIIAIKLTASKQEKISFTLSAEIPYRRSAKEKNTRTGKTFANNNLITLSGSIPAFSINYEGQVKVIPEGGSTKHLNNSNQAKIIISNANSVTILIAAGTNYDLNPHIFLAEKNKNKLDSNIYPHEKVSKRINNAAILGFQKLKDIHLKDYQRLFERVQLEISDETTKITTPNLLENYKHNNANHYLEELMFHYGRYLLIASSRKGTLPCGLQGVWSQYAVTPWTGGYWHNINVQMNYWGAFNTNLEETFIPYLEYFDAYLPKAKILATAYIKKNNAELSNNQMDNGWAIGTGATAYIICEPGGHSGPGTGGFTSKLLWDYYEFTQDTAYLREKGYPALLGVSKFLSRTLKPAEKELLLVDPSSSPEQSHHGKFYTTKGTTFDQGFVWETYNDLLKAAKTLSINDPFLKTVKEQLNKLDPIIIGKSGQVKEFREEEKYGDIGDKYHRHTSHLCALYPGTLINSNTPEWISSASKTLDLRRNKTFSNLPGQVYGSYTGWALAHRMNLRARTKEAEKAHELYSKFIKELTVPNLWTIHPPFQIDGNLGTMAGVSEMLLQSHEGFIEILPALPKKWKNGKFTGLKARGNFEVSVTWKNNELVDLKLISNVGGKCAIRYKHNNNVLIKNNLGEKIPFTQKEKNIIEFETNTLEKYFISF